MKPLESGCLAVLALPPRMETPVHVVQCLVFITPGASPGHDIWAILSPLKSGAMLTCSCCLTRIDGGDPDAVETKDKELTV